MFNEGLHYRAILTIIAFLGFMKRGVKKQSGAAGSIRVISGKWRGRKLPVLNAEGLRPTTDRNKETLFNWLMADVQNSTCLDMFAGSGGLGIESLSRHAKSVTFVEKDKKAYDIIRQNLERLGVEKQQVKLLNGDAIELAGSLEQAFDLVFVDPPFNCGLIPKAISLIEQKGLVKPGSKIYIECESKNQNYPLPASWQMMKEKQTQAVSFRLFEVA